MAKSKTSLKIITLVTLAGLSMANQKCEEKQTEARRLKKNVRVLGVEASDFMDNSGFKFSEVAKNQFSGVLFETNHFFERNVYPSSDEGQHENFPNVNKVAFDNKMMTQLKTWFPTMKSSGVDLTRNGACLVSRPQHLLYTKINSLEAHSGGALQFGFSQTSVIPIPLSAHIKIDKMRMDLSMHAYDPWTQQKISAVNSEAFKKDYAAGFGIDIGPIHIGPEIYRNTGMAEVTLNGLRNAVKDLANALLAQDRQEWQTRVLVSMDNRVVIVGGAELGLKKGDLLKVENEVHDWMGQPCGESSILIGSVSVTREPWIVKIEEVGNMMSVATVTNIVDNTSIDVGALVRVQQLVDPAAQANPTSGAKQ